MTTHIIKKDALYERLKQDILLGHYKEGERLPSEPHLASALKAGRVTVRSALERLEKERLVLRYQGKGTFVANRSGKENYAGHYLLIYFDSSDLSSSTLHIMPGIEQYCARLNIRLTKMPLSVIRFAGYERSLEILGQDHYSGVILLAHCFTGKEVELEILKALKLPVVLPHAVKEDAEATGFATLYYQVHEAAEEAVRYQVALGLKRFAMFNFIDLIRTSAPVFNWSPEDYLLMLKRNGADASPELIYEMEQSDLESVERAVLTLREQKPEVRSIFCCSDFCALRVYQACAKHGIRIPEDLTVMGFCGYPGGRLLAPSLSTVDLQYENIGHMAVDVLRHSDEWFGREAPCLPTPHQLIPGGSTDIGKKKTVKQQRKQEERKRK